MADLKGSIAQFNGANMRAKVNVTQMGHRNLNAFLGGKINAQQFKTSLYGKDQKINNGTEYGKHTAAMQGQQGLGNGLEELGPKWEAKIKELEAKPDRTEAEDAQLNALKDRAGVYRFMQSKQTAIDEIER